MIVLVLLAGATLLLVPALVSPSRRVRRQSRGEERRARAAGGRPDPAAEFVPLPVRLELVGAMLSGGLSMPRALATLAAVEQDPWLGRVSDGLALGLAWDTVWDRVLGTDPAPTGWRKALPALARWSRQGSAVAPAVAPAGILPVSVRADLQDLRESLGFATATGAPSAGLLRAQAARARKHRHRSAEQRAASLGVRLMLPLGLCSLPAFVCLGIVPVLIGLLPDLW